MFLTSTRSRTTTGTATGTSLSVLPSCPYSLSPHERALPLSWTALEWYAPPEIDLTLVSPDTLTGVFFSVPMPDLSLPSWPSRLAPHDLTLPLGSSAREWNPPAATAFTPERFLTRTGTALSLPGRKPPLPSCPEELSPQALTIPSCLSARACRAKPSVATVLTPERLATLTGVDLLAPGRGSPLPSWPS